VVVPDNDIARVEEVRRVLRENRIDLLVGVGGGSPLDVAKFAAAGERVSFLAFPTTPSNDGIASPVAVLRDGGHPRSLPARVPIGVVADLDILEHAPLACVRAGAGDLLSNLSAVADWDLACRRGKDRSDDFARLLSLTGAEALLRYGDGERRVDPRDAGFLEVLVQGLVLSGLAMEIAGSSRPSSGAEHLFSHALDRIARTPAMHGVQVGLGTLLMTHLRNADSAPIRACLDRIGAPTHAAEIGIADGEVVAALLHARHTRPERYTILDELVLGEETARAAARAAGLIDST
jgi:glycerol-1-phosphate dehydrogenase [NAD(P)+]